MREEQKELQLQIRVSPVQKKAIFHAAKKANMGMSQWVLSRILPEKEEKFQRLLKVLKSSLKKSYCLAEIHDLLQAVTTDEFEEMVSRPPCVSLSPYWKNYVAAMIESAAQKRGIQAPFWTSEIEGLNSPVFGSDLQSLRLYLLTHSPACFRKRNIFIDASVGERV